MIAVFYHAILRGPRVDTNHCFNLLSDQMATFVDSGLADAADKVFIGVNGDEDDRLGVQILAPEKAVVMAFPNGQSEIPTMTFMQGWLAENPPCNVLYFHMKGATYPGNPVWTRWRKCMENVVLWNWRGCVKSLESGIDTCGAHWLTPEKYQMIGHDQRYWGGNFFWATSSYLRTLPQLAKDSAAARYEAEVWIGKGKKTPRVHDFAPHFPMNCPL